MVAESWMRLAENKSSVGKPQQWPHLQLAQFETGHPMIIVDRGFDFHVAASASLRTSQPHMAEKEYKSSHQSRARS
jgi:hypothetical protein